MRSFISRAFRFSSLASGLCLLAFACIVCAISAQAQTVPPVTEWHFLTDAQLENMPPDAIRRDPFTIFTRENEGITASLGNRIGAKLHSVTYSITHDGESGSASISLQANGTITYAPKKDFVGEDEQVVVTVNNGIRDTDVIYLRFVTEHFPFANPVTISGNEDTIIRFPLEGYDSAKHTLNYLIETQPAVGEASTTEGSAICEYRPPLYWHGTVTFTYVAVCGDLTKPGSLLVSRPATVTVVVHHVNHPPITAGKTLYTVEDLAASGRLDCTDVDRDSLTYSLVTNGNLGTATITDRATGAFTYTPHPNMHGVDAFSFSVSDGKATSNISTVLVNIEPLNDLPVASAVTDSTVENVPVTVRLKGADVDHDLLSYQIDTPPAHGTITGTGDLRTYTPAPCWHGTDTFTYTVSDGQDRCAPQTVTITVMPVNYQPKARNALLDVQEDTPASSLLSATDADSDTLTYDILTQGALGTVTLTDPATGAFTYTPLPHVSGTDRFTFMVTDGQLQSNTATVTVTIVPINDPPTAESQSVSLPRDTTLVITLHGSDVEGSPIRYAITQFPANGIIDGTGDTYTYAPNPHWSGEDHFTFVTNDGTVDSAPATVTITVDGHAPTGADTVIRIKDTTAATINIPTGVTDAGGGPITYRIVQQGTLGTALVATDELLPDTIIYDFPAGTVGVDTFSFIANDGVLDSREITVTVYLGPENYAPVAENVTATTAKNTAVLITLQASDIDGNPLTYTIAQAPQHGTLSGAGNTRTYTPSSYWSGTDTFTFVASDGALSSNVATVTITVPSANAAPFGENSVYVITKNPPSTIQFSVHDEDPASLTYRIVQQGTKGTVRITGEHGDYFEYQPNPDFVFGYDTFTFIANDGELDSREITHTLFLPGDSEPPIVEDQTIITGINVPVTITLQASDPDGDRLYHNCYTLPTHGTLLTNVLDNRWVYTPSPNWQGTDSFTYYVGDTIYHSRLVTVTINVLPAPVATDQTISIPEDTTAYGTFTATDPNNPTLTYAVAQQPTSGVVTITDATTGAFTYTPNANFTGTDRFTFTANNGQVDSAPATITINVAPVNDAPGVANETYRTAIDTPLFVDAPGILDNDQDIDGDTITPVVGRAPAHGTLSVDADGAFVYVPHPGWTGTDYFMYTAYDGAAVSPTSGYVTIIVEGTNHTPEATDGTLAVTENLPATGTFAVTDADGDLLTYRIVSNGTCGTATLIDAATGAFTYIPNANTTGTDTLTFCAGDGLQESNTATIAVTIHRQNLPPVATGHVAETLEDTPLAITLDGRDEIDAPLLVSIVTPPNHGTLTGTGAARTYIPAANWYGDDQFTFTVNDGELDSAPATIAITVTPVNDAPVGMTDAYTLAEDATFTVPTPGVLGNDSDIESDPITAIITTPTLHGTLTLQADGSFSYTPDAAWDGEDSFTYQVTDGQAQSIATTVTLTVTPVNHVPVAQDDVYQVNEDQVLELPAPGVLENDTDVDGQALTVYLVNAPEHGTVALFEDGSLRYRPDANWSGVDTFTYCVNDGECDSLPATVTVTVTPVNTPPVAMPEDFATDENIPLVIAAPGLLADAIDDDGDPLTTFLVVGPQHGTLELQEDGSFVYIPETHWSGTETFTYRVNDGQNSSEAATVTITVTPVNATPVAEDDTRDTTQNHTVYGRLTATDDDGDTLTYRIIAQGTRGVVTITNASTGNYKYEPALHAYGTDTFTFVANDGTADSNIATITVTIARSNQAPTADPLETSVIENGAVAITLPGGDADGDALTYELIDLPAHGTLDGEGAEWSYTPDRDFVGSDTFTYRVSDGEYVSETATVTIHVTPTPLSGVSLSAASTCEINTAVELSATPTGGSAVAYRFEVSVDGGQHWTPLHEGFIGNARFSWTPRIAGAYLLRVSAKNTGSESLVTSDTHALTVMRVPLTATLTVNKPSPQPASNGPIRLTAALTGSDASTAQCRFRVGYLDNTRRMRWTELQAYGTSKTCLWTPPAQTKSTGTVYTIVLWVKTPDSLNAYDLEQTVSYKITR